MKIGIDLDDIVADFFPSFLRFYNLRYGKNIRFEDITKYHIWKVGIGKDREEAIGIVDAFYESDKFSDIPLVDGARHGVESLIKLNGRLKIITSRPLRFREKTMDFLKKYFDDLELEIHYSSGMHEQGETKAEICKRYGINVFVEDCLEYAEECAENGVRTLLLNKPWNQGSNGKVERAYNWREILEKLGVGK